MVCGIVVTKWGKRLLFRVASLPQSVQQFVFLFSPIQCWVSKRPAEWVHAQLEKLSTHIKSLVYFTIKFKWLKSSNVEIFYGISIKLVEWLNLCETIWSRLSFPVHQALMILILTLHHFFHRRYKYLSLRVLFSNSIRFLFQTNSVLSFTFLILRYLELKCNLSHFFICWSHYLNFISFCCCWCSSWTF